LVQLKYCTYRITVCPVELVHILKQCMCSSV
jgi:hypothetical protein